jgi:hypothetical protein
MESPNTMKVAGIPIPHVNEKNQPKYMREFSPQVFKLVSLKKGTVVTTPFLVSLMLGSIKLILFLAYRSNWSIF